MEDTKKIRDEIEALRQELNTFKSFKGKVGRKSEALLKISEDKFKKISDMANDAIIQMDDQGRMDEY